MVLDERTEVVSHVDGDGTRTRYYLLLREPNGERRELECSDSVAGTTTQGDLGVVYVRGGLLLDFKRVAE